MVSTKEQLNISVIPIFPLTMGGSGRRHQADTTPRVPRLSLITTVSHYRPHGGHGGSGDRKHHPPILPQWAVRRQKALSKAWTQANSSIHVAMYGRCLGEPMEGYRSMLLIQQQLQRKSVSWGICSVWGVEVFYFFGIDMVDFSVHLIWKYRFWVGVRRVRQ